MNHSRPKPLIEATTTAEVLAEAKRLEERLVLCDRLSAVGGLAGGVAHEINNPLAAVITNLEFLTDDLSQVVATLEQVDPSAREALRPRVASMTEALSDASLAAGRVRQIVRELKAFARPTAAKSKPTPLDVRQVLESALRLARNETTYRTRIARELEDVPAVLGTEAELAHVFLTLIVNAAQAMPDGKRDQNQLTVATSSEGDHVVVRVRDNGPGIPADIAARIFDPFFTTKTDGHPGLGLSIARSIVERLGGTITLESEGGSTCASVRLPAAVAPVAKAATIPPPPAQAVGRRGRLLIVDDDALVAGALARILQPAHDVVTCTDPAAALERLALGQRFDIVFCDVMMPSLSVAEFFAAVARLDEPQSDRIVFMTGEAFTDSAREFLSKSPNPCVEKPFEASAVRALVTGLLAE